MYYNLYPLNQLARKYGRVEYVRDIFAAANNRLKMLYAKDEFYIAEDSTYESWLSVMGNLPSDISKKQLFNMIADYVKREKYIAVYTNIQEVSTFFKSLPQFTYHKDFLIGEITNAPPTDETEIRLATLSDLNFIDKTYPRSAREQLQSRIIARQMWVAEKEGEIMGCAGIHKDGSLGFEYVAPKWRKKMLRPICSAILQILCWKTK